MPLPSFVIAGERKCGTSALQSWMAAHPDVFMYPRRDLNYFIDSALVGRLTWMDGEIDPEAWSPTHSPEQYAALFEGGNGRRAIGEKSADYLFWRPAHRRLACFLPNARFIIMLRNPVTRAWSHYWDEIRKGPGRESLSFLEAIAAEPERSVQSAYARHHLSYIARGYYEQSLEAFFEHVDRRRVLVLTLERALEEPLETLRAVYAFIGVDAASGLDLAGTRHNENRTQIPRRIATAPWLGPIASVYNRTAAAIAGGLGRFGGNPDKMKEFLQLPFRRPARRVTMPAELKDRIAAIYQPHVEKLEELMEREFHEWKEPLASARATA